MQPVTENLDQEDQDQIGAREKDLPGQVPHCHVQWAHALRWQAVVVKASLLDQPSKTALEIRLYRHFPQSADLGFRLLLERLERSLQVLDVLDS